MQKETIRQKKIGELIQNELASVFIKIGPEIYPNVMFTIMKVRMSQDLSFAKIYISVFPIKDQNKAIEEIKKAKTRIKIILSNNLKNQLRRMPEILFFLDDSNEYYDKIDKILKGKTNNPIK